MTPRATYDFAALGRLLRPTLQDTGRGYRACADEIGVSASDLSRVTAGQSVSAPKVFAICDWIGIDPRSFYTPGFTGNALKQPDVSLSIGGAR